MSDSARPAGVQFKATGTIAPRRVVKLDSANDFAVLQSTAGDLCFGISQFGQKRAPGLPGSDTTIAAESGDMIDVYEAGTVAYAEAGAAITTRDNYLKSDANGQCIIHTTGSAHCIGRNLTLAAGTGSIMKIWVAPQRVVLP